MATPRRVEILIERRRAVRSAELTLEQMEYLSTAGYPVFSPWQRWLWCHVIYPIGVELGEYPDEEDDDDLV